MSVNNTQSYYVGALIMSVLGGIALLFADFAWWYNYNYYTGVQTSGSIYAGLEIPLALIILGTASGLLFISTYISFLGMQSQGKVNLKLIEYSLFSSSIATGIVIVGGLIFVIVMLIDDPTDWNVDLGFFGGFIGGGLTAIFYYLIRNLEIEK